VNDHEKCLFLFAHPDDDVFVAGTMRMLLDRGKEVHGVWVTSGEARKPAALREAELKTAMAVLGVESMHLLRLPNRGLLPILDPATDLVAQVLDKTNPDCVITTAYEGGHIDHDAVNFIAVKALERSGSAARLFEFPLYNRSGRFYHWWWKINRFPADHQDIRYVRLTEDAARRKHLAMRAYASQRQDMIPFRLVLTKKRLLSQGEPYRPCSGDRDFMVPPHGGRLNYEGWFNSPTTVTFSDFRNAVTQFA
jgi:LmbE family N-acetylglucosaminyl deacetylase